MFLPLPALYAEHSLAAPTAQRSSSSDVQLIRGATYGDLIKVIKSLGFREGRSESLYDHRTGRTIPMTQFTHGNYIFVLANSDSESTPLNTNGLNSVFRNVRKTDGNFVDLPDQVKQDIVRKVNAAATKRTGGDSMDTVCATLPNRVLADVRARPVPVRELTRGIKKADLTEDHRDRLYELMRRMGSTLSKEELTQLARALDRLQNTVDISDITEQMVKEITAEIVKQRKAIMNGQRTAQDQVQRLQQQLRTLGRDPCDED